MSIPTRSVESTLWAAGTLIGCFCILLLAWYAEGLLREDLPAEETAQTPSAIALTDRPAEAAAEAVVPAPSPQPPTTPPDASTKATPRQQLKSVEAPAPPRSAPPTSPITEGTPESAPTALARAPAPAGPPSPTVLKPVSQERPLSAAALIQSLTSRGVRAHASVSGDPRTATLSVTGPTLKRETGLQWLGNKKVRDDLKAAGIRVVVLMNGQESWTFML